MTSIPAFSIARFQRPLAGLVVLGIALTAQGASDPMVRCQALKARAGRRGKYIGVGDFEAILAGMPMHLYPSCSSHTSTASVKANSLARSVASSTLIAA